jgi:hypothetical protein
MKKLIISAALTLACVAALAVASIEAVVAECERQMILGNCAVANDTRDPVFSSAAPPMTIYGPAGKRVIPRAAWSSIQVGGTDMCQAVVRPALVNDPGGDVAFAARTVYPPR